MRIIAGTYRSRRIIAPPEEITRPTSDRLRETLFNVIAPQIPGSRFPGSRFLDLYAGSGAVGLEALSRGAAVVYSVESNKKAVRIIQQNLNSLGITDGPDGSFVLIPTDVATALRQLANVGIGAPARPGTTGVSPVPPVEPPQSRSIRVDTPQTVSPRTEDEGSSGLQAGVRAAQKRGIASASSKEVPDAPRSSSGDTNSSDSPIPRSPDHPIQLPPGFDIVFLDPPYRDRGAYEQVLRLLAELNLVAESGIVIAEHEKHFDPGDSVNAFSRYRTLKQGDAVLSFYRRSA